MNQLAMSGQKVVVGSTLARTAESEAGVKSALAGLKAAFVVSPHRPKFGKLIHEVLT
ncbi:MAG: hypothetical protein WCJ07_00375 [Verrucomicrobiota bacterium]